MIHPSEEELVLHYYGEEGDFLATARHLEECADCMALYTRLQRVLNEVDSLPVPDRGPDYGAQVWRRIERDLPVYQWWRRPWGAVAPLRWALAGTALAAMLVAAFLAGRFSPRPAAPTQVAADPQARERVLRVALEDYLDRSQIVLVELANASPKGPLDVTAEQERAHDLINETRLYRQTAATTGDTSVAGILDELEQVLMDIARGPSKLSPAEVEALHRRLEAESILFKIRVVNSNVRSREAAAPDDAGRRRL
jgi:hypothetical protein